MQHDYLRMHSFISVFARMFFASLVNADSRLSDPTKQRQTQQSEPGHVNTFRIETENTSEAHFCVKRVSDRVASYLRVVSLLTPASACPHFPAPAVTEHTPQSMLVFLVNPFERSRCARGEETPRGHQCHLISRSARGRGSAYPWPIITVRWREREAGARASGRVLPLW